MAHISVLDHLPASLRSTYFAISLWYNGITMNRDSHTSVQSSTEQVGPRRKPLQPRVSFQLPVSTKSHSRNFRGHRMTELPFVDRSNSSSVKSTVQKRILIRQKSPPEEKKISGPLVIFIPSIELISAVILRDLVELTSLYINGSLGDNSGDHSSVPLPIFFVFGLSSTADLGLEARCDASTLSHLLIKRFKMPSPTNFLQTTLTELINIPGFRLSHTMLSFIIDSVYMCLDYSVKNLLKRFKAIMLTHYLTFGHTQLLSPLPEANTYFTNLSHEQFAALLSAFPSLLLSNTLNEVTTEKENIRISLPERLSGFLHSHWRLQLLLPRVLSWLLALFDCLTVRPLTSNLSDLYRTWLAGDLVESPEFSQTVSLFRVLNKSRIVSAMDASLGNLMASIGILSVAATPPDNSKKRNSLVEAVGPFSCLDPRWVPVIPDTIRVLSQFKEALVRWRSELIAASDEVNLVFENAVETKSNNTPMSLPLSKRLTLRALQEQLKCSSPLSDRVKSNTKCIDSRRPTPFKSSLDSFFSWLVNVLASNKENSSPDSCIIPAPKSLPLFEVFYGPPVVEIPALRRRLNPPFYRLIHQALSNPGSHFKCAELCLSSPESVESHLPDLCVLYKLHLEAGKLINLYDWLVAFSTVLDNSGGLNEAPSRLIQCRFLRGICELEFLGFIKPTRRKVDHVARLTHTGLLN